MPEDVRRALGVSALTILPDVRSDAATTGNAGSDGDSETSDHDSEVAETDDVAIEGAAYEASGCSGGERRSEPSSANPHWRTLQDKLSQAARAGTSRAPWARSFQPAEDVAARRCTAPPKLILPIDQLAAEYVDGIFALTQAVDSAARGAPARILAITSPRAGDGKSLTALNLAAVSASTGARTLLVDCDLRTAALTSALQAEPANTTLITAVAEGLDLTEAAATTAGGFDFCAAQTADQATLIETLGSARLGGLLRQASKVYDLVIIDTAGLLDYPDARSIVYHSDAALLVLNAQRTTRDEGRAALNLLHSANMNDVHCVLTQFREGCQAHKA
jgi:Mrp family chromosome partitioning ATPase